MRSLQRQQQLLRMRRPQPNRHQQMRAWRPGSSLSRLLLQ